LSRKSSAMLANLTTEARNPASERIDGMSALEIVRLMNSEDATVAGAVGREAESIAQAIEVIAERLRGGGRLVYLGAGTSGRLGVLDASECPPTFSTPPGQVVGLIAGGYAAMTRSVEGAEDHPESAEADLKGLGLCPSDVVVGIATSGRTPYVVGGLKYARSQGAYAIGLSCNRDALLGEHVDLAITPVVGPEVISGSTRLKAGTATKMVLNMLTTGAMVLLRKTYGNLMVDLRASNTKLVDRARRMLIGFTGLSAEEADRKLSECGGELKTAIVAQLCSLSPEEAGRLLEQTGGHLRRALEAKGIHVAQPPSAVPRASAPPPATRHPPLATHLRADQLVLGVDGGGSRTVAWVAERGECAEPTVLGRGTAGSSNPQSLGLAQAMENLDRAVTAALADAHVPSGPLAAAVLALAGSDRKENQEAVERWAKKRQLARWLRIVHDAVPVLAAGSPEGWGIALISGTGSFAFGRDRQRRSCRAGGWGFLFGDEGSGYAIALAGLRCAAQAADGRGPATRLVDGFLERLQLRRPEELIPAIYRFAADRAQIAALAEVVLKAADQNDAQAREIIDQAARDLARLVQAVARKLRLADASFPLAFAGGLLTGSSRLQIRLASHLADLGLRPDPVRRVAEPVAGAVKLAFESLES